MTSNKANHRVEALIAGAQKWQAELKELRAILLECGLTEELKWGAPCYTLQGKMVTMLCGMKDGCGLAFFKGALLKDEQCLLAAAGKHSRTTRLMSFTTVAQIAEMKPMLAAYIYEAIEIEKAGLRVEMVQKVDVPEELQQMLDEFPALRTAFDGLTPSRQSAYISHFSAPKLCKTRK